MTSTIYSADARFVLSGSDDGNVRLWKAKASEKLGVVNTREKAAMEYRDSLRERWKMDAEVSRLSKYVTTLQCSSYLLIHNIRNRRIPQPVRKATQLKHTMLEARRVKEERRRKHTRAGASKPKAERKKIVIQEQN